MEQDSSADSKENVRVYHVEPSVDDFAWRPSSTLGSSGNSSKTSGGFGTSTGTSSLARSGGPSTSRTYFNNENGNSGGFGVRFSTAGSADTRSAFSGSKFVGGGREGITEMIHGFVSTSILGFASTAMVMPFEVGKTLLQVQYLPKESYEEVDLWRSEAYDMGYAYDDDTGGIPETEEEVEMMFTDAMGAEEEEHERKRSGVNGFNSQSTTVDPSRQSGGQFQRDENGYLVRRSVYDLSTKPAWVIPELGNGVWDMIRAIGRFSSEGYTSLWKGQLTTFVIDSASTTIQPVIQSILSSAFLSPELLPSLPIIHSPHPMLPLTVATASHALTGLILLPLDLVRTRLIVQSAHPRHRTYRGPIHALKSIINDETIFGSAVSLCLDPRLFFPALLDSTIRPLLHIATPLLIERQFNVSKIEQPVAYGLAELALGTASLLVTLPIETVRRRLQVQRQIRRRRRRRDDEFASMRSRTEQGDAEQRINNDEDAEMFVPINGDPDPSGSRLKTCVETRDRPYFGIVHCVYCILVEETSKPPGLLRARPEDSNASGSGGSRRQSRNDREQRLSPSRRSTTSSVTGGLSQLYRGFSMGLGANIVVFLLQLATGESDENGWAEM